MKVLSLYIDKWYIVGAVIDGANKTPLFLSNAEDRVWLYFYSNSTSNAVKYSRRYRDEALEGKKGYYGDVFDLLPDYKEFHYEKYGARKEMKDIFADSGILNDLRRSFENQTEVPVYLSFSKDVDIVSQHIFIKALEDDRFQVLQYTLPIERLALEHLERRGEKIKDGSNVLIVNACNENLQYTIFQKEKNDVILISQRCEHGYGVDCRIQAIVEEVLEYLQAATHFLTGNQGERYEEMLYLSQFADTWLRKIDESPSHLPVALGNIHFKKQAQNNVPVIVSNKCLNDRTKNIIDKLTGKIVEMIKEKKILLPEISHIVFLGDVFSNNTFVDSLQKKIGVCQNQIVKYADSVLPDIVSMYNVWTDNDFEKDKSDHVEAARKKFAQDRQKAVEQKTSELKSKATIAEDEGRLQEAIDYYRRILYIDPNDNHSLAKISSLDNQLKQIEKDWETINELLEKARQNLISNKYKEAVENCEEILRLQKDNVDALKIKEDAEKVIKRQRQLDVYIKKMENLLDTDKFFDARNILIKVDALNLNDVRLKAIRERINSGMAQLENQVRDKATEYELAYRENDFQTCLRLCDELLDIGADSTIWHKQKNIVQDLLHEAQRFQEYYSLAQQARQRNTWSEVIEFAKKALSIKDNFELQEWIDEAENVIKNEANNRIQEKFILSFTNEQWDKVIELYDANDFLHLKASFSSMYLKAKKTIKSTSTANTMRFTGPTRGENTDETVQTDGLADSDDDNPHGGKKRFGPSRPNLVHRPTKNNSDSSHKEMASEKKIISSAKPKVGVPSRFIRDTKSNPEKKENDNSFKVKNTAVSTREKFSDRRQISSLRRKVSKPENFSNTKKSIFEEHGIEKTTKNTISNNFIFHKPKR